jgi:DNA (cytosine-5)-methyltransferase 1
MNYGSVKGSHRSIESPAGTVVVNDKHNLVTLEHFIYNTAYKNTGSSIDKPSPTIIARQDKAPLYLLSYEVSDRAVIPVYEDDTETMVKIKKLMAEYGISNIYLRMFKIPELLKIQGFPEDYLLIGNQSEQKKYIGNAVEVTIARKLFEAHSIGIAYLRSLDAYTLTELLTSLKMAM